MIEIERCSWCRRSQADCDDYPCTRAVVSEAYPGPGVKVLALRLQAWAELLSRAIPR